MRKEDVFGLRMRQQLLSGGRLDDPADVVAWLGAVQAQDYHGAKWALGLRSSRATEASVEAALDRGGILRTHVMRPTWHFVDPEDIRWMLSLTSARVALKSAYMHRRVGLDKEVFARSNAAIAKAVEGKRYLTRQELGASLAKKGIAASGVRLTYLVMQAELDAIVCSGPRRGRSFTYALLDERAPKARSFGREEALGKLAELYFVAHGPATLRDFSWWSGLTMADARAGLESAASLSSVDLNGEVHWTSSSMSGGKVVRGALLLPTYDELLVGYSSFDKTRRDAARGKNLAFTSPVVLDGRIAGTWRRRLERRTAVVDVASFGRLSQQESEEIEVAAERYGTFAGLPARCSIGLAS